ncbi:UxaA family hydrolase [Alteromonadaceae bacterium BrNp21-10]|nr:UxaA family hydrolase [Alteromonadaceae bacterium BrNp21-10]
MSVEIAHFIQLHPQDNVVVCCTDTAQGYVVALNGEQFQLTHAIEVGHKVASQFIHKGQKIIKYGVAIGSATQDIAVGEHVHLTNLKSDYIASHTRLGVNSSNKD